MSGVAAAIGGTAVLGYVGSQKAADAATTGQKDAAAIQGQTADKNIEFQKWLWGEQKALLEPYSKAGLNAIDEYGQLKDEPLDLTLDPGYQFRLDEGRRAYENSASAKGNTLSGAQAKALTRFGQGAGSQEYGAAFNRRQTNLDNLYRMISLGSNASTGQANAGGQMGTQVSGSINTAGRSISDMYQNIGNINAAGAMAPYNTLMDVGNLTAQAKGAGMFDSSPNTAGDWVSDNPSEWG